MSSRTLACSLIALGLLAAAAPPALAGQQVQLRSSIALHDGRVTLGDLFDGAGPAAGVIAATSPGQAVVLDAGRGQALAMANGLDWSNANGLRRIIARTDVEPAAAASAGSAARPGRSAAILAWARDINPGEVVQAEDMVWSKTLAVAPSDAPRDPGALVGQAARRPLRMGMAVGGHDVSPAQVIKRDDIVSVAYEADGIRLVLQGKATSAAAVGDLVVVLNTASKKQIQAVATGPGEAVAGPGAERLRASLAANPQFLASLR